MSSFSFFSNPSTSGNAFLIKRGMETLSFSLVSLSSSVTAVFKIKEICNKIQLVVVIPLNKKGWLFSNLKFPSLIVFKGEHYPLGLKMSVDLQGGSKKSVKLFISRTSTKEADRAKSSKNSIQIESIPTAYQWFITIHHIIKIIIRSFIRLAIKCRPLIVVKELRGIWKKKGVTSWTVFKTLVVFSLGWFTCWTLFLGFCLQTGIF